MKGFIMWKKLMACVLVLLHFAALSSGGYYLYQTQTEIKQLRKDAEKINTENMMFRAQTFLGMGRLIEGQVILSKGQLRIHHFSEPHADTFYPNCDECIMEKKTIDIRDSITMRIDGEKL